MDLAKPDWSEDLLRLAGLEPDFFPEWRSPGSVVGELTKDASQESGLPVGTPILAGGHDTQFALLGSGSGAGEAVLSSGTWEILALRVPSFRPTKEGFQGGLIFEADAVGGLWDPQMLMMGSGVLEWVRTMFFGDLPPRDYRTMIDLGRTTPAGSQGVRMIPSFVSDSGPTRRFATKGTLLGLGLHTGRGEIYRATLEGLSFQLRQALEVLAGSTGQRTEGIRLVGGGSRNPLWNQIRADVTGLPIATTSHKEATVLPITTTSHKEATVLGAALVAFTGVGLFDSVESAFGNVDVRTETTRPGEDSGTYQDLFQSYDLLPHALQGLYRGTQRD
jgi:L-fuculokinase